jgi:hypothetical protein
MVCMRTREWSSTSRVSRVNDTNPASRASMQLALKRAERFLLNVVILSRRLFFSSDNEQKKTTSERQATSNIQ